ncbi:MAG: hypothetical protein ACTS6P_02170, partial [Candidatus Hodgkinia cicadicola]
SALKPINQFTSADWFTLNGSLFTSEDNDNFRRWLGLARRWTMNSAANITLGTNLSFARMETAEGEQVNNIC